MNWPGYPGFFLNMGAVFSCGHPDGFVTPIFGGFLYLAPGLGKPVALLTPNKGLYVGNQFIDQALP